MKTNKIRFAVMLLVVVLCMTAFSITVFASDGGGYYSSNEDGEETPPSSIDSISVSTEDVHLSDTDDSSLTPDGNLSLIDDILQDERYTSDEGVTVGNKQFITVQSKNGNYFYIVIDRSGDTENVYFLNLVDEADLMELMEDDDSGETLVCTCKDKCTAGDVDTDCPVCKNNMSECAGNETVTTTSELDADQPDGDTDTELDDDKSGGNNGLLIVLFVLALGGGGAFYYFKFVKNKPKTKGPTDLDDYDYGDDEDDNKEYETKNEDEAETVDSDDEG